MFSVNLSGRIGQHFTHLPSSARNNFSLRQHITTENNQLVTEGRRRSGETVSRKQKSSCFLNYSDSNKNSHTFIALSPAVVWHCDTWALYRTRGLANHPFLLTFSTTKDKAQPSILNPFLFSAVSMPHVNLILFKKTPPCKCCWCYVTHAKQTHSQWFTLC